jgi:hypothetical protein
MSSSNATTIDIYSKSKNSQLPLISFTPFIVNTVSYELTLCDCYSEK